MTDCDGSLEEITDARECNVNFETLMNSPFSLPIGEVINVKMIAYNYYGESSYSPIAGN